MADLHRITIEVDRSQMFEVAAKVGDGGRAVGERLAGVLLGGADFASLIGLGVYGISIVSEEKVA